MEVMIVDYMFDSGHWTKLSCLNKQNKEFKGCTTLQITDAILHGQG
jgi:hypothetical protein